MLDEVSEVEPLSYSKQIPKSWARLGGWRDYLTNDPPDEFWCTLVADRGRDGKPPLVYYSYACKESFRKSSPASAAVSTTDLINIAGDSIISQFCRRVQAVIWNRALIKTKSGRLGLVGGNIRERDLICIFHGCSVPVVLR